MAGLLDPVRIAATIVRVLERSHPGRDEAAARAVGRALRRVADEDPPGGLAVLEYAQRLAPSDDAIAFAIGLLRLVLADPRASEALAMVAARHDALEAALYAALALLAVDDVAGAVAAVWVALAGNAPPAERWIADLAHRMAAEARLPGWCYLRGDGRVVLAGPAARWPARELAVALDDQPIAPQPGRGARRLIDLPDGWRAASLVTVMARGMPLLGSPLDIPRSTRVEGFVEVTDAGGIRGWCWFPGEPHRPPVIEIQVGSERRSIVAERVLRPDAAFGPFAMPRRFAIAAEALPRDPMPVAVVGPHGKPLHGSPVWPAGAPASARAGALAVAALFPVPADGSLPPSAREPVIPVAPMPVRARSAANREPPLAVVIPVYRGVAVTRACLESVLKARSLGERVIVVADAPPEPEMHAMLGAFAATGAIALHVTEENRGFPSAANTGLRAAAGCDVVLLNSDTVVPPDWLRRLRAAAYQEPDIGTATPLSNDATIFSYPATDAPMPMPDADGIARLAHIAHAVAGDDVVEVPTGHGFCLFIRAACLAETGLLREDVFAQGYGEENDFCLRARALGWRHVAAPGVYVGHVGSQSFGATRRHLIARNLAVLNRLHPGYDALIRDWIAADPLAAHRRRMDIEQFLADGAGRRAVALVTHDRGGGVLRHVRERAAALAEGGDRPLLLRPQRRGGRVLCAVSTDDGEVYPDLRFSLPDEADELLYLLRDARVRLIELHHFIGHHASLVPTLRRLGCPLDVVVHDYAWFCARITLITGGDRYCGEPPVNVCADCIADNGERIDEAIAPAALVARSADWLGAARTVIAPSHDAARRIGRHFPVEPHVGLWEPDPSAPLIVRQPRRGTRLVCVPGAISVEKGFPVLLALVRHVARADIPLAFVVVGHTCDDARLLDAGPVRITGPYEPGEAVGLIRAQGADLAFLPSIWPETWSYALSEAWEAGLAVVAFDIGAPAERIRARGAGLLLPLQMPAARIAEALLTATVPGTPV